MEISDGTQQNFLHIQRIHDKNVISKLERVFVNQHLKLFTDQKVDFYRTSSRKGSNLLLYVNLKGDIAFNFIFF